MTVLELMILWGVEGGGVMNDKVSMENVIVLKEETERKS